MARSENNGTRYPGGTEEGHQRNLDQRNSSWGEDINSDEGEDIDSEGDINSSSDSIYFDDSPSSPASTAISMPRQQHQQQGEGDSSSSSSFASMDFDSSSSSSSESSESSSVSSPKHELARGFSNEERDPDGSNRKESGSAKLMRILYGSSSSYSDDSDILLSSSDSSSSSSSSSSTSEELDQYRKHDEEDIILKGNEQTDSPEEEDAGIKNDSAPVDENQGKSKETIDAIMSPKNEEHIDILPSTSPASLDIYDDEIVDYEVSPSSQERMNRNTRIEGNISASSIAHSDIQSKSRRENDKGKDSYSLIGSAMAVPTTSPDFSTDSKSRSSTKYRSTAQGSTSKSPPIISNPLTKVDESLRSHQGSKNSNIEDATKKSKSDSKEDGDSPVIQFTHENSSSSSGNELERKKSTIWVGAGEVKDSGEGVNDIESDGVGWKPPALTTFSPSNYEQSPREYRKEKIPKAQDPAVRSIQRDLTSPSEEKAVQRKRKTPKKSSPQPGSNIRPKKSSAPPASNIRPKRNTPPPGSNTRRKKSSPQPVSNIRPKKDIPPPVSSITISPPPDDESTLGTVGTYLERQIKRNPKKKTNWPRTEKTTVDGIATTTPEISRETTDSSDDEISLDRNGGFIGRNNMTVPFRLTQDENEISERIEIKIPDDLKVDQVHLSHDDDEFRETVERLPSDPEVNPAQYSEDGDELKETLKRILSRPEVDPVGLGADKDEFQERVERIPSDPEVDPGGLGADKDEFQERVERMPSDPEVDPVGLGADKDEFQERVERIPSDPEVDPVGLGADKDESREMIETQIPDNPKVHPDRFVEYNDKIPGIIETKIPDNPKSHPVRFVEYNDKIPGIIETRIFNDPEAPRREILDDNEKAIFADPMLGNEDPFENHEPRRADPPGDSFLFSYDHHDEWRPLLESSHSTPPDDANHVDKNLKSSEPSSTSVGHSILTSSATPPFLLTSLIPMSPWVPTSTKGTGEDVDINPTRAFINSLIGEKRSLAWAKSKINGCRLENDSGTRLQQPESEYSKPRSDDERTSESTSKNISTPGEMPPSDSSSSNSYAINVLGDSSSWTNERGQNTGTKASPNISQSESPAASRSPLDLMSRLIDPQDIENGSSRLIDPQDIENGSNNSKTSSSSKQGGTGPPRRLPGRRASMSRLIDPQEIENKSKNSKDSSSSKQDDVAPARRLPGRRVSMSRLVDPQDIGNGPNSSKASTSKQDGVAPARRLPGRRVSMSRLIDPEEIENGSNNSKASSSSKQDGVAPVRKLPRRRASTSRLIDPQEIEDGSNDSESSSSSSKQGGLAIIRRLPRGMSRLIMNWSKDSGSSSSSSIQDGVAPARKLTRGRASMSRLIESREIIDGSNDSDSSDTSSSSSRQLELRSSKQSSRRSSRRRKKKTMMLLLWWFMAVLIIATTIIVVVLWRLGIFSSPIDDDSEKPTASLPTPMPTIPLMPSANVSSDVPSFAPTKIESEIDLLTLIIEAYPQGQQALADPNSPQSKALKWLESSENSGISESRRILQRYALATLYYATNGDDWANNTGWLSAENECNWMSRSKQSICDRLGDYITLDLQENNLNGTLPGELGILSDTIRSIITRQNSLSGKIPSSTISDLKDLQVLDLSSNSYSGVLDLELFQLTSLTRLSLFENNIASSIPKEIGQLTQLDVLDLGSNKLTSTIPSAISNLSKLAGLSLFNNLLSGTVPSELSGIKSLEMLYIDSNNLEAPVPIKVCDLEIDEFWGDCEKIQCNCCTTCCHPNFGCFDV